MQSVYLETTIPSYLAARPSGMQAVAADQQSTHAWWSAERKRYALYTSIFVADEAAKGDAEAAARRLGYLDGIRHLTVTAEVAPLATDLARLLRLPKRAVMDASHLAMCVLHRIDYLLTWNCTHLANPVLQKELVEFCSYHDYFIPILCTPESLLPQMP